MHWIPKFALLSLACASLYAEDCCPDGALQTPGSKCRQYEGVCGHLFPAVPCINNPCGPDIVLYHTDLSILAWQAIEEGLAFAMSSAPLTSFAATDINGRLVGIDFNWEPAFKIDFGFDFPNRAWAFDVRWTFFYTHSTGSAQATPSGNSTGLFPLWLLPSGTLPVVSPLYGTARGSWHLHLNQADIILGYDVFLSPAFSLCFNAGVKAVDIHQNYTASYGNGNTSSGGQFNLISAQTDIKNDCWGAGPRLGFDSKWRVGKGLSLHASFAGSFPLSHFEITRTDSDTAINLIAGTPLLVQSSYIQYFYVFRPVLESALGLGWDGCFGCRCQYAFGFRADYELQYFCEQNMMAMLLDNGVLFAPLDPRGDLHLHGVSLSFHFGF